MFNLGFINLDLERKIIIRDSAIEIYDMVTNYFKSKYNFNPPYSHKLDKAYNFFRKQYNTELTQDEKNVFYLYILFPDDDYFMNLINRYEKNFEAVANLYSINASIVKLRYLLQKNIIAQKESLDTYKKQ